MDSSQNHQNIAQPLLYPIWGLRRGLLGLLVVFSLAPITSRSQDTLKELEKQLVVAADDSTRVKILVALSDQSEYTDYPQSRRYADQAFDLAEKLDENWAKAITNQRMAFLETLEGDYYSAMQYDKLCVQYFTAAGDTLAAARSVMDVGLDYRDLGEIDEAYDYLTEAYRMVQNRRKVPLQKDSLYMAIILHNMGTLFMDLQQYDVSYNYYATATKISKQFSENLGKPYTADRLGELFREKKEFGTAQKYMTEALRIARERKIRVLNSRIQSHLARLALDMGEYDKSLLYYDSVTALHKSINNNFGLAECELGRGMVMMRTGNHAKALQHYQQCIALTKEINARNLALSAYRELAALYESKSDYRNSYLSIKEHNALRDSLYSQSTIEKLFQNRVRFETEGKDTKIAALSRAGEQQQTELKRQELIQNILVVVAVLSTILLFTLYRSGQRRKRITKLLLDHQEEIKKRSLELEQLNKVKDKFFSVISHDLRSPLNALSGSLDLLEQKHISPEEFTSLTQALRVQFNYTRGLVNNLLDWTLLQMDTLKIQQQKVVLRAQVEESFSALKNLYPKNISMENKVPGALVVMADPNVLSLVLRNLVCNAMKFTESGGRIWVEASEKDNEIIVSVSDNGIGIKPEAKELLFKKTSGYSTRGTANEKGTGLGLILCKEFIEKSGGRIWLESELGKGTTFYFTLPKATSTEGQVATLYHQFQE
ncbi:MAG: tetratricopeptide repeat protein [Cyclobacteriaceae bacterium]|nr:tetratricopeptide repeat protein [Cyclobacteriaceae bacterium]